MHVDLSLCLCAPEADDSVFVCVHVYRSIYVRPRALGHYNT